jgi:hypothetical protein
VKHNACAQHHSDLVRLFATWTRAYNRRESTAAYLRRVRREGTLDRLNRQPGHCIVCGQHCTVNRVGAILGHAGNCIVGDYELLPLARRQRAKYPAARLRRAGYRFVNGAWRRPTP